MLRWLLLLVLLAFLAFAALAVWAYNTWGVWGFLGVAALLVLGLFGLVQAAKYGLKRLFFTPFKLKGAVLKGATIEVHSIVPTQSPEEARENRRSLPAIAANGHADRDDEEFDDDDAEGPSDDDYEDEDGEPIWGEQDWYLVDVTIVPQAPKGPFQLWEPGELVLASMNAKADSNDEEDELGGTNEIKIWQNDVWVNDDGLKVPGPQRLLLQVHVQPGTRLAQFRYYFELFGELEFPAT